MRRGMLLGAAVILVALLWQAAESQPPLQRVRLQGAHTQVADVDHTGALFVTAPTGLAVSQSGEWTLRHVTSVVHIAGAAGSLLNVAASQSGAWTIQAAHQGGEWTIRHVTAVLHVSIIQGGAGGASHLLVAPVYQAGPWNVSAAQSGVLTVQAAHQGGQWNIAHVTSVVHVRGTMQLAASYGQVAFVTHIGALAVTCYTNAGVAETCGGGGSSDAVNVFHQSTVRHVSSVTHVAIVQGGAGGASHLLVAPVYQAGAWTVSAAQSGAWTVQAAHQGGEWNIRHVSSVTHIEAAGGGLVIRDPINPNARARVDHTGALTANPATYAGKTLTYVSVNQGVAGTTTLAAASVGNKHKVLGVILTMSLLGTLKFNDGVADLTGPMDIAATGGLVSPTSLVPYVETGAANRALDLVTTLGAARGVVIILTEP